MNADTGQILGDKNGYEKMYPASMTKMLTCITALDLNPDLNETVEITPEMIHCVGCRIDGSKTPYCESLCPIRQCAMKKQIQTCGSCAEMGTCEKLAAIIGNNPDAIRNLKG